MRAVKVKLSLISGRTYDKVRTLVEVVPLGPIQVKCREKQVEVDEVVGQPAPDSGGAGY